MNQRTYLSLFLIGLLSTVFCVDAFGQKKFLRSFKIEQASTDSFAFPPSNNVSHMNGQNGVLWIGTSKGLANSVDGGRSWISYRSDPAFANDGIFAIAVSPETVWASTGYDKEITDGSVQTGSGYAVSNNAGSSWQHLNQTLDNQGDSLISYGINDSIWMLPVLVPEQNVTFDIALTQGRVWIASWASGLRTSTNNGQDWQRILLPPDNRNSIKPTDTLWTYAANDTLHQRRIFPRFDPRRNNNFLAFGVYAVDADTIWCGTAGGVNKSTDGGQSWIKFNHQNQAKPILGNWVIAIKEQRYQTIRRVWTTNWKADDIQEDFGVSYTDDGGASWTNLLQGIRAYDFSFKDSICYIATDDGIYRTADGGLTLVRISNFVDNESHQIITSPQVFTSAVVGDTVFIGTTDGIAKTIDNASHPFGASWKINRNYFSVGTTAETYAYPNPFSPVVELVRIHYGSTAGASFDRNVRIEIFDFGMNRVRTLLNNVQRASSSEFDEVWDGRDDHGRFVANGIYFYRIDVDAEEPRYGKILVLQ